MSVIHATSASFHPLTTCTLPTTHADQGHLGGGCPPHTCGSTKVCLLGNSGNPTFSLLENVFKKQVHHNFLPKFELDFFEDGPSKWPEWHSLCHNLLLSNCVFGYANLQNVGLAKVLCKLIEVGLKGGSTTTKAWALCETGCSHCWISESLRSELSLSDTTEVVSGRA